MSSHKTCHCCHVQTACQGAAKMNEDVCLQSRDYKCLQQ
uniref:Uncharacterized protein n=1 Tax=Anguilla anguilla TaxID=7936 RepID=A0A0E9VX89_ANGAN